MPGVPSCPPQAAPSSNTPLRWNAEIRFAPFGRIWSSDACARVGDCRRLLTVAARSRLGARQQFNMEANGRACASQQLRVRAYIVAVGANLERLHTRIGSGVPYRVDTHREWDNVLVSVSSSVA